MNINSRIQPWLKLADELAAIDRFMQDENLCPTTTSKQGHTTFIEVGTEAARRMHVIAANRWTWYGWKRDGMYGVVAMALRTFHRWIAEGFFYAYEETEAYKEMCNRIESIENKLDQLKES